METLLVYYLRFKGDSECSCECIICFFRIKLEFKIHRFHLPNSTAMERVLRNTLHLLKLLPILRIPIPMWILLAGVPTTDVEEGWGQRSGSTDYNGPGNTNLIAEWGEIPSVLMLGPELEQCTRNHSMGSATLGRSRKDGVEEGRSRGLNLHDLMTYFLL